MITSPEPTGVDMGQTHDDWHEWRHGTDKRLDRIEGRLDHVEHELRIIRWLIGGVLATQVGVIGFLLVLAEMVLSTR